MNRTTSRPRTPLKALGLVSALVLVIAAGVLPACVPGLCCPTADEAAVVHAQMPCCAGEASMAPRDVTKVRPATFAGYSSQPQAAVPVAVVNIAFAEVPATRIVRNEAPPEEPTPPLFLLNAQFLI